MKTRGGCSYEYQSPRKKRRKASPDDTTARPRASFLTIPGELRNTIYELALIDEHGIMLDNRYRPPGLLSTNKQIRAEALRLYYQDNTFIITANDVIRPAYWWRMTRAYDPNREKVFCLDLRLTPARWSTCLRWLRAVQKKPKVVDVLLVTKSPCRAIEDFARLSKLAQRLRGDEWTVALRELERARGGQSTVWR